MTQFGFFQCIAITITLIRNHKSSPTEEEAIIVSASNEFGIKAYKEIVKLNPGKNIIFSPFSIHSILYLLLLGARGKTANELQAALSMPTNGETLEHGPSSLWQIIKSGEGTILKLAALLYVDKNSQISNEFKIAANELFLSHVEDVDFENKSEDIRKSLNSFANRMSHGKLTNLIPEGVITSSTKMLLLNSIYFKGSWLYDFDKSHTISKKFFAEDGKHMVDMLTYGEPKSLKYNDIKSIRAEILLLPYKGGNLNMVILLPSSKKGLSKLESVLDTINLVEISHNVTEEMVEVELPKFSLEEAIALNEVLKAMGVQEMFDESRADLSGINDGTDQLYVNKILHKSFLDVNEKGSEASSGSAASVGEGRAIGDGPSIIPFTVNRPFFFFIQEQSTGIVLFMGSVRNPSRNEK